MLDLRDAFLVTSVFVVAQKLSHIGEVMYPIIFSEYNEISRMQLRVSRALGPRALAEWKHT